MAMIPDSWQADGSLKSGRSSAPTAADWRYRATRATGRALETEFEELSRGWSRRVAADRKEDLARASRMGNAAYEVEVLAQMLGL
jgi:hypothetical protein